jgi:hypothetical protein
VADFFVGSQVLFWGRVCYCGGEVSLRRPSYSLRRGEILVATIFTEKTELVRRVWVEYLLRRLIL